MRSDQILYLRDKVIWVLSDLEGRGWIWSTRALIVVVAVAIVVVAEVLIAVAAEEAAGGATGGRSIK